MTDETRQRLIEHLRSICVQANEAIDAVKASNYGNAIELVEDCARDLEVADEILGEEAG